MSRYIDKDSLEKKLLSLYDDTQPHSEYNAGFDDCICVVQDMVSDVPEADVVEVKHGKWIDVPLNMSPEYFAYKYNLRTKCSACSYAMPREYPHFKICPNCGAKMDGDEK